MKLLNELGQIADEESLPVRGAWIEIKASLSAPLPDIVAPREGSVD